MPELAARGIRDTGNPEHFYRNGLVATAGGLLFIGTQGDRTVRALDKATGAVLWERVLPAGPTGMPAVYEVKGRQFIAFFASVSQDGKKGPVEAQGYYVFALPSGARTTN